MVATVHQLRPRQGPRSFTSNEEFIEEIRNLIFSCGKTYTQLAVESHVSNSTIANIASGKTRWPRHTTLFPLTAALSKKLALVDA